MGDSASGKCVLKQERPSSQSGRDFGPARLHSPSRLRPGARAGNHRPWRSGFRSATAFPLRCAPETHSNQLRDAHHDLLHRASEYEVHDLRPAYPTDSPCSEHGNDQQRDDEPRWYGDQQNEPEPATPRCFSTMAPVSGLRHRRGAHLSSCRTWKARFLTGPVR
jgi:hypothetical protein